MRNLLLRKIIKAGKFYKLIFGEVVKQYTYEEFLAKNGKLKIKQLTPKGNFVIGGEFDYIPTQKTFCEIFPNIEKDKLYYVEDDSFYVEEQETE